MADPPDTLLDAHRGEQTVDPVGTHGGPVTLRWMRRGDDAEIELITPAERRARRARDAEGVDPELVATVLAAITDLGADPRLTGARLHLAAEHDADDVDPLPERVADDANLSQRRDLFQLRLTLPLAADHPMRAKLVDVSTRAFVPGTDDEAWLRVNNRAFADHPDQGHETALTLAERMDEPWFDAAGFLVVDDDRRPGELAAFCWTKVHAAAGTDPRLGEIYVIGVDPSRQGEHLGPSLVMAGLDHLAATGVPVGMLYVDESNAPARRLYDQLGFATHRRRRVYTS